jgi:chitin-binding protein
MKLNLLFFPLLAGVAFAAAVLPEQARAHGTVSSPVSRAYKCYVDGGYYWPTDGSAIPNAACRAAFLASGDYPFKQWNEVSINILDYLNTQAVREAIPNGQLCSANDSKKSGLNLPSNEWHRTRVSPEGGKMAVDYLVTAPHSPSYFEFYLSKPGYDGLSPLGWDDLDLVETVTDPSQYALPNGGYRFSVSVPTDRAGDAVLFTRWQRIDEQGEGFYACSDIVIDNSRQGGQVNVPK